MADYVYIKDYSKNGNIAISRRIFEEIALDAVKHVSGASVSEKKKSKLSSFSLFNPVKVTFHKNGQVEISISIVLSKGVNASKVCLNIQEEVSSSLLAYTESVPFSIEVKVASFDNETK